VKVAIRLYDQPDADDLTDVFASRLYDATEAAAHEQEIGRLFVEASEPARRLFERKGFEVLERQDLIRHSVAIHNYRMEKVLARGDHDGDIGCSERSV
jgi:putative acetyltransferase